MQPAVFTKLFDDRSLEEAITAAAEIGYDGVEIMARDPHLSVETSRERAYGIRTHLDQLGLGIPCLATYTGGYARVPETECRKELEVFEKFLELAEILEVDLVRHHAGRPSVRDATEEDFKSAAKWLQSAADRAETYDKTVGLEIHSHRLTETVESTLRLIELIDRDNVSVIHDAGNMFIVDDDYGPSSVESLDDRLGHVHVKDLSRGVDQSAPDTFNLTTERGEETFRRQLLGEGDVDHGPLFEALGDRGYDGFVTAETNVRSSEPEEVAEFELEGLRGLINRSR